ncbi:MAG: hypothetical protein J6U01_10510 [Clostridia bacterium]|nr:hypothetical protein [Clostridia bacterium]
MNMPRNSVFSAKHVISLVLSLCLLLTLTVGAALADEVPQPEGGKKFETNWAADNCLVEIDYEEEGYRVCITRNDTTDPMNLTGDQWQYNCHYDESKDALVSMHSERSSFTVGESSEKIFGEPKYSELDPEGTNAVFTISADGKLEWNDPRDHAGDGVQFSNIGNFKGNWKSDAGEAETVSVKIQWNGTSREEDWFYTVWVTRGATDAETYTVTLANCDYDAATGKLSGTGSMTVFTKNAQGEYDSQDSDENAEVIFSKTEDGKLLYEAANGIVLVYDVLAD